LYTKTAIVTVDIELQFNDMEVNDSDGEREKLSWISGRGSKD
jgi:hypothetical protein